MSATTEVPAHKGAGFPPFRTETFPSQIFWLTITFAFLFVVLWRVAGPRIHDAIALRRGRINDDLAVAQGARRASEEAANAYESALKAARARAQALAEENRKMLADEIAAAKSAADAEAGAAMQDADARITVMCEAAKAHIARAATDAAIAIVARLIGDTVSPEDAAAALAKGG